MVVICHVSGFTRTRVATPLGGIGVAMFLICSGYGMYNSYYKKGLKGFWRGRFRRVVLPYWIAVILYYIVNFNQCTFNRETIAKNLLLIEPAPYLWFIQYLMIFNVVFWSVFLIVPEKQRILAVLAVSLTALFFLKSDFYAEQSLSFVTGLILGKFLVNNKIEKNKAFKMGSTFLAISVVCLGIKQFPQVRASFYIVMNIVQMCIKLFGACGILFFTWKIGMVWNKAFALLGKCSYEIYIVHMLLIPYLATNGVTTITMFSYLIGCGVGVTILHKLLQKCNAVFS